MRDTSRKEKQVMAHFAGPLLWGVNLPARPHPHNRQHYVRERIPSDVDHRAPQCDERFNYRFEQPQTPEGSESEHGG